MEQISVNQNFSCLALGTPIGYKIFSLKNLSELSRQTKDIKSIKLLEMFYLTNIILFVQEKSPNEIVVFDDYTQTQKDTIKFEKPVTRMILRQNRLYVLTLAMKIEIFDVKTLNKICDIEGVKYFPSMCLEVPTIADEFIGWNVENSHEIKLQPLHVLPKLPELQNIDLHKNNCCKNFTIDRKGTLIASNSKGTIIKLYDINAKTKRSFSLNLLSKDISCLYFIPGRPYLAVVESSGYVKILNVSGQVGESINQNTNILQKLTRETSWMNFSIPFKNSKAAYNETVKSLFFYSPEKDIVQCEVNFNEKVINIGKSLKLM